MGKTNWCSYMVPRENYAGDICGPREGKYILHIIDAATSFWMCEIIPNTESITVMMATLKLCWKYGFPTTWKSDNAPYWNEKLKKLKECGCKVSTSNSYHHEGNNLAENAIGNLQHIMRKLLIDQIDKKEIICSFEDIIESLVIFHSAIDTEGESPSKFFLGRKLNNPSYIEKYSYGEEGPDAPREIELLRLNILSQRSARSMLKKIIRKEKLKVKVKLKNKKV